MGVSALARRAAPVDGPEARSLARLAPPPRPCPPLGRASSARAERDRHGVVLDEPVQQQELRSGVVRALWNRFTTRVPFTFALVTLDFFALTF